MAQYDAVRFYRSTNVGSPFIFGQAGLRKSAQPLNFTLGAMRNLLLLSVSPVAVFAAGLASGWGLVASRLAGKTLVLPVRLFSRAAVLEVSRSSLARSLLHHSRFALGAVVVSRFWLLRSVAVVASNLAFKRDAAEARRPLTLR